MAGGAIAKLILKELNIRVESGLYSVADVETEDWNFEYAEKSSINAINESIEPLFKEEDF